MGDQLRHHGVFADLVVFRGVLDVDFPAGKAGRQAHVLAFPANGQAELVRGHKHVGVLAFGIHQAHHFHPGWTEGIGDVLARIGRPADHVNFFAAQLIHHLLDAGAPGADAGTDGVHFPLDTVDGHLGAGAHRAAWGIGFAGHGHDAHRAFLDFRYLVLKQIHHQAGVGPTHKKLGTAPSDFAHFLQEHLEGGVRPVVVVGELVAAGKLCLHLGPAQA